MKHRESDLQIRCIKWFRYQYPAYARLLYHPKNEGNGNRRQGAISKAEGVQPGVADLILHVPALNVPKGFVGAETLVKSLFDTTALFYTSLAVEMKTPTGTQSKEQRQWQRLFEAAGGKYIIARSYEEFTGQVTAYLQKVPTTIHENITFTHDSIQREADEAARRQFRRIIGT